MLPTILYHHQGWYQIQEYMQLHILDHLHKASMAPTLTLATIIAEKLFGHQLNHIYNSMGQQENVDSIPNGTTSNVWNRSLSNKFTQLAQGNEYAVVSTNTIDFTRTSEVPHRKSHQCIFLLWSRPIKDITILHKGSSR